MTMHAMHVLVLTLVHVHTCMYLLVNVCLWGVLTA